MSRYDVVSIKEQHYSSRTAYLQVHMRVKTAVCAKAAHNDAAWEAWYCIKAMTVKLLVMPQ